MPLNEVIAATTVNAAMAVKRPELGTFSRAASAMRPCLDPQANSTMSMWSASISSGTGRIKSEGVVLGGRWWHPTEIPPLVP
jgi:dihydroorotase